MMNLLKKNTGRNLSPERILHFTPFLSILNVCFSALTVPSASVDEEDDDEEEKDREAAEGDDKDDFGVWWEKGGLESKTGS